ncbi:MAG: sulfatase [Acidobacteriota bacterium]
MILVSIDTLSASHLAAFDPDAPEHPALDTFARGAHRFVRAYSTASWTLPSHASVFTGLYPVRHGAVARGYRLPDDMPTLAECAEGAGYQTVAFTGGGYLDPTFGLDRGFERYSVDPPEPSDAADPFRPVVEFLRQRRDERPLFLFAHTYLVHDYFEAHPWARAETEPFEDPDRETYLTCLRGEIDCPASWWSRMADLYAAEIRAVDRAFGELLTAFDEAGLEDPLILVFSDHGEGFEPERRRIHHGGRLHKDMLHVPLMMAGPDVQAGRSSVPVSLVDLMPTVVDHLGWSCSSNGDGDGDGATGFDGRSLVPLLTGGTLPERPLFASEFFYDWSDGPRVNAPRLERPHLESVIAGDRWLIVGDHEVELYDLDDTMQRHDLAPTDQAPEDLSRLLGDRDAIDGWQAAEEDPEVRRRLEALGYL